MPPADSIARVFELAALARGFQRAGIATVALKGPALSQLLHGDPHRRPCRDLDILTPPDDIPDALRVVRNLGYEPDAPFHRIDLRHAVRHTCEIPLHKANGVKLDLHWGLAAPHYPLRCPVEDLFASARPVRLASTSVLTPAGLPLLRYLAFHGAKHVWEKAVWIEDIAALLAVMDPPARAEALSDPDPAVQLALALAHASLGSPRGLAGRGMDDLAAEIAARGGREPETRERADLARRLGAERSALVRHWIGCLLGPTELDWDWLALPDRCEILYPAVRVARLAAAAWSRT